MEPTLSLEVGRYYKSDDGQRVVIVERMSGQSRDFFSDVQVPIFKGHYEEDGKLKTDWFYEDGESYFGKDMRKLLSEWNDAAWSIPHCPHQCQHEFANQSLNGMILACRHCGQERI